MAAQGKSLVTDIEYLSKTRNSYQNELSFAGLGLKLNTRDDVKDIVSQILKKEKIEVLRLEGNTISPEAADELSKALVKHPELERFIGNDIFTSRSKEEIPPALKSICGSLELCGAKLVEINMSDNAFGPIGLDALVSFFQSACCYSLKEIRMHNNGLGPQGATKFAHALDKCYENSGGKLALKVFVCGRNRLEFEGARTIGNTLKTMGTLEEIQMPQNGIRPNAIEFLAEACANNPNLRVINFNDNTFRKIGAVLMGKSLDKLNHVEYINFGDCLIRSKGALEIARALQSAKNLKEVILSFNEISLQAGIEIAQSFLKNKDTLKMLDLNGNKFGEEGKLEIKQILQPLASVLCTLSEDEGSDEEEEEEDEDEVDEESEEDEDEEGEEEEEVDDDDDYDQVDDEDYEDYEGEYDEERDEEKAEQKFGGFNIAQPQQPSLFSNFKGLSIDNQAAKPNLFTNLVNNSFLLMSIEPFDAFVKSPNLENLKNLDENLLKSVLANQKFNGSFLIKFLVHLSKVYDPKSAETNDRIFKCASYLTENYLTRLADKNLFADEVLIEFGFLKSEDKHFKPVELTENLKFILQYISKQSFFPSPIKDKVVAYLTVSKSNSNPKLKERNCDLILNCFS